MLLPIKLIIKRLHHNRCSSTFIANGWLAALYAPEAGQIIIWCAITHVYHIHPPAKHKGMMVIIIIIIIPFIGQ